MARAGNCGYSIIITGQLLRYLPWLFFNRRAVGFQNHSLHRRVGFPLIEVDRDRMVVSGRSVLGVNWVGGKGDLYP